MARENKARFAVLGILTMGAASGYDIKKTMEQSTDHFWREGDGSIYPILKQLLKEGLVDCKSENLKSDKPKKTYNITAQGRKALQHWLEDESLLFQNRDELLLKIFFGWNAAPQITIERIEMYERYMKSRLNQYKELNKTFLSKEMTKDRLYRYLTLKAGLSYLESRLKWAEEALRMLNDETT